MGAVIGREIDVAVLTAATDLDAGEVAERLEPALRAGLVSECGGAAGHVRFSHALIRDTIYGELSALRRATLHARVGGALERREDPSASHLTSWRLGMSDQANYETVVARPRAGRLCPRVRMQRFGDLNRSRAAGSTARTLDAAAYARHHDRVRAGEVAIFYDVLWWLFVRPLLAVCRVRAVDAHHVPRTGAVILAPNHTASIDHLLVAGVCGRRLSFMAKSSLFDGRMRFVNRLGAFPVQRGARDEQAIETALAVLRRGGCLVMYCEGTVSRDGSPRAKAKPGVGRLGAWCQTLAARCGASAAPDRHPECPGMQPACLAFGMSPGIHGHTTSHDDPSTPVS